MLKILQNKFEGKNIEIVVTGTITMPPIHLHRCSIIEEIEGEDRFVEIEDDENDLYLKFDESKIKKYESTYMDQEILQFNDGQNLIIGIQGNM